MNYSDMTRWDRQLADWFANLPALLKTHEPCPENLLLIRSCMRWRVHVQRMLLFRPALLSYAMRRVPYVALRSDERRAVDKCFAHAAEAIHDISSAKCTSQIWGWSAVWFLSQAVLIPLLGLYINDSFNSNTSCGPTALLSKVEAVIASLIRMRPWGPFAVPTLNGVCRLHEAMLCTESSRNLRHGSKSKAVTTSTVELNADHISESSADLTMTSITGSSLDQNMWDYITWSDERLGADFPLAQFNATFSTDAINQYYAYSGEPDITNPYSMAYNFDY